MIMMSEDSGNSVFDLSGGAICLDFANTLADRPRSTDESLTRYGDILRWSRQAETLPAADLDSLEHLAEDLEKEARSVFDDAIALREAIYRIFSDLADGDEPANEDLDILTAALPIAMTHLALRSRRDGFEWTWRSSTLTLDRPLWPIVRSAAELLTSDERARVRECGSETCSWLFIDRSRNRRRRWCDMTTCGNRAKAGATTGAEKGWHGPARSSLFAGDPLDRGSPLGRRAHAGGEDASGEPLLALSCCANHSMTAG